MARIVLVADDSPTIQRIAMGILKGDGFEVETASNGVAAIKRLALLRPVVILADVSMPGRDGYEVCDFVKKSPDLSHVPVLLIVSDMEPYDSLRATQVGADGIIKKPFEARELISTVGKFATQYEAATIAAVPVPAPIPIVNKVSGDVALEAAARTAIPTVVQQVEPAIPAKADGIAFLGPVGSDGHTRSSEANPAIAELPVDSPHNDESASAVSALIFPDLRTHEIPLGAEAPPSPADRVPTLPRSEQEDLSAFPGNSETPSINPLVTDRTLDATPAPTPDSAVVGTTTFQTPLEIADTGRKVETAAPVAEPAERSAMEPIYITEELAGPFVTSHEHPHEHPDSPVLPSTTSPDGLSLNDAAAGQVRFAPELREAVQAPEVETAVAAAASTPPESTAQEGNPEAAAAEPTPEGVWSQATLSEASQEAINSESPPSVPTPEDVSAEAKTTEATGESVRAVAPLPEPATEEVQTRTVALKPPLEAPHSQVETDEPIVKMARGEDAAFDPTPESFPYEISPSGIVSEALLAKIALLNADVEEIHAKIAHTETALEAVPQEIAPEELVREPTHPQEAAIEPSPLVGKPKHGSEDIASRPGRDTELVRRIVQRAVLKMAHPILAQERVDEITQQLTDKIVAELRLESSGTLR